ncbi:MAG: S1C family serine protease [Ktedonobacteraceae bacterium]
MFDPNIPDEPTRPGQLGQGQSPAVGNQLSPGNSPATRGRRTVGILLLLLLLGSLLFIAGWAFGRGSVSAIGNTPGNVQPGAGPQATIPQLTGNNITSVRVAVIAKLRPTVVQVNVTTRQGGGIGSGVIIDKRGYIVTNNHVVNGAQGVQVVLSGGSSTTAQITGTDPADDLAILKITPPSNMAVATLGDSSHLHVGDDVLAIGNPLGITQSVTNGIVSALGRNVVEGQGSATIPNAVQTDAPINPGNSGGALVDLQGNLVGIPTLTAIDPEFNAPANGVGFAIPSNRVKFIAPQIIQSGRVIHTGRAVLGVSVESVDSSLAAQYNLPVNQGALVVRVQPNGPAAKAGLQAGDVIVQVDNTPVVDTSSLGDALVSKDPGNTVAVRFYRGKQQSTVNVTLGELSSG